MIFQNLPIIFFFIVYLSLVGSSSKHDFRYISHKDLHQSIRKVDLEGATPYTQMLFDVSRNQLIIGTRNTLYRLHLEDLQLIEAAKWEPTIEKRQSCINKGQQEENCHNYIKILLTNGHQIFACGTNAFSPLCSWRHIDELSNVTKVIDGIAKCPYDPAASVTGFLSDNHEYFFGGTTDFSNSDPLISKSIDGFPRLRTKQYNSFWLNDPQFVGSFESSRFAYFVFKETAVEYINCGKVVYSRIARVCKNDQGGHTMLKDNWTTFIKARLNCSVSGDYPFYYNEIQSVQYIPEEQIMYATFTTPANSIAGSAICAFNMTSIDQAFSGPFKYQNDMNSAWTTREIESRDHLECRGSSQGTLDARSQMLYQLMDTAVQSTTLDPLHIADLERFTHITVDIIYEKYQRVIHVIYVATEEGLIKKLTLLTGSKKTCIVELWQVSNHGVNTIKNMQFLKETSSIYVTTDDALINIPADHCRRYSFKEGCLNAMDPYCGWNELEDHCTSVPGGNRNNKYWIQILNSCPVLDTPVDGGWGAWSEWQSCYHKASSDVAETDQCLCRMRQCNNPAPVNDGLSCAGASVAVTNCTLHGGWSDWSPWSACSATCGTASKTRIRTCTNPAPAFGGRVCVGQDRIEAYCADIPPCPAEPTDGGWSAWLPWSPCSANCAGGYKSRKRHCDNPPPKNGGQYCKGNDIEYEECNEHPCKDHKQLHATEWITDYNISRHQYHQKRYRITCKGPVKYANQIKIFVKDENQVCHGSKCETEDNDHNGWSSWSNWSECSVSCGGGTQSKTRHCFKGNCLGFGTQTRDCNKHVCEDSWGCWSEWSPCNVSCGWGAKTRYRECLGQNCRGPETEKQACQDQPCENILGWGNWTEWSLCDENDLQYRKRTCYTNNPGPHMCQGSVVQSRMCVGNILTNEINDYSVRAFDCSCTKSNLSFFFLGLIVGVTLVLILYLIGQKLKRKKYRVPSSPHYITELNPYISVPPKEAPQLKKQNSYSENGTIKSKFSFDFANTLKRNSNDLKNTHVKPYYDSDHLYE